MLKLYRFPGATCAAKVLMALHEKAMLFEDVCLDRADLATDWYRRLNPDGVVPTVVHDGVVLVESSIILNYIEDRFFGSGIILRPEAPLLRAAMNHWLKILDDLLPSLATATYAIAARDRYLALSTAEREAYYATIPDSYIRQSRRDAIELGLAAPEAGRALSSLAALTARVEECLFDRLFLCGEFSLADIAIAPFIARMDSLGLLAASPPGPLFDQWWARIRARPSFIAGVEGSTPAATDAALRDAGKRHAAEIARLIGSQVP